jgi:hypothetical protein
VPVTIGHVVTRRVVTTSRVIIALDAIVIAESAVKH